MSKRQKMTENKLNPQQIPLVSIIIPFYNREKFLADAIESVLKQSIKNWELLLIDDGSTDRGVEIVQQYIESHPEKIYLLCHSKNKNKGASASRNLGIKNAKGQFITFLDSDDIFFHDTLEKELNAFEKNPEADAVCGTLQCWYSWSVEAESWEKDFTIDLVLELEKLYQPPDLLIHNLNAGGRKPGINCVMVRSDFARRFELFEDGFKYAWEDQVFWSKVSLFGKIYVMDAILAKYRQHPASTTAAETESGKDISSMKIFLDWLEVYLREQKIEDKDVWKALRSFRRVLFYEIKFKKIKKQYRQMFPLHIRYKIRDKLTIIKKQLPWSAHRHK